MNFLFCFCLQLIGKLLEKDNKISALLSRAICLLVEDKNKNIKYFVKFVKILSTKKYGFGNVLSIFLRKFNLELSFLHVSAECLDGYN